jgi:hypothetical protein
MHNSLLAKNNMKKISQALAGESDNASKIKYVLSVLFFSESKTIDNSLSI